MKKLNNLPLIYSQTIDELREFLISSSCAKYTANQIYGWLYKKLTFDSNHWTNISKKVSVLLNSSYSFKLPEIFND